MNKCTEKYPTKIVCPIRYYTACINNSVSVLQFIWFSILRKPWVGNAVDLEWLWLQGPTSQVDPPGEMGGHLGTVCPPRTFRQSVCPFSPELGVLEGVVQVRLPREGAPAPLLFSEWGRYDNRQKWNQKKIFLLQRTKIVLAISSTFSFYMLSFIAIVWFSV